MQGIAFKYSEEGLVEFDFSTRRNTRGCLADRTLINLGTERGTCPIFSERGVNLLKRALAGLIYDGQSAQHQCNFAAQDSLFFLRRADTRGQDLRITDVVISPDSLTPNRMSMQVQLHFSDGTVDGLTATLA